jgi:hypothetical protein
MGCSMQIVILHQPSQPCSRTHFSLAKFKISHLVLESQVEALAIGFPHDMRAWCVFGTHGMSILSPVLEQMAQGAEPRDASKNVHVQGQEAFESAHVNKLL